MNRHGRTIASLGLVFVTCGVAPAWAAPTLSLSWDQCSPIVMAKQPEPGVTSYLLFLTATGMDEPHKAFDVSIWLAGESTCDGPEYGMVPDAWRFDPGGCQDSGRAEILVDPPAKTCPRLSQEAHSVSLRDITYEWNGATQAVRVRHRRAYPAGVVSDPTMRYYLMSVRFDHSASVVGPGTAGATCGGLETPMCFTNGEAGSWPGSPCTIFPGGSYSRLDGQTIPFGLGDFMATFAAPAGQPTSCFAITPARASTWGAIKGQYRD